MNQEREKLSLITFNIRGTKQKEQEILKLADRTHILGICETWLRKGNTPEKQLLSELASVTSEDATQRGFGGVGMIINPLIRYTLIANVTERTHQYVCIRTGDVHITTLYFAPKTNKETDIKVWDEVTNITKGKSIIIGDLNARHKNWDKHSNPRGIRFNKWAHAQGWKITAPTQHTCQARNGTSTPDIVLYRGIGISDVEIPQGCWNTLSDHRPVRLKIESRYRMKQNGGKSLSEQGRTLS